VQGSGSGVDVAASTWGGFLRFDPADPARSASVPAPRFAVVWSGQSARTGPRVQAYKAWSGREAFVRESAALTHAFANDPVAAVRASRRLLVAMAESAGLDYRTPELDRLADMAEACGGAGKPSGAGGGDCLIAVFPDDDARAAFVAAAGPGVLPLRLSAGVHEQGAAEAASAG
jgi:phosphomevalonate kinase